MMDRDRAAARSMYSTSSSRRVSAHSVTSGSADCSRAAYLGPTASTILFFRTEVSAPAAHWISPSLRPIRFGSRSRTMRPRASHWPSPFFWSKAAASQAFLNRPWVSVRETFSRSTPFAGPGSKKTRIWVIGIQFPKGTMVSKMGSRLSSLQEMIHMSKPVSRISRGRSVSSRLDVILWTRAAC